MISEERLQEAAKAVSRAMLDGLPEPEDCQHDFSPEFERNMEKLIRKSKHQGGYHGLKRVACFFLAFLFCGGAFFTVNAEALGSITGWLSQQVENAQRYFYTGDLPDSSGDVRYHLEVPKGYWLEDTTDLDGLVQEIYCNDDGAYIFFTYQHNTETTTSETYVIDTDAEKKQVSVNGVLADLYLSDAEDANNTVVWTDPVTGTLLDVTALMGEDDLIDLAESVAQKEK